MVMFDTLNRRYLPPYGCDQVYAPNFTRLAEHVVTFETCYAGSLPCMPARREIHTGRYNFLHRGWGTMEPYDDSMPEILKQRGIYSHLISDHYHYWEDGGATYHPRYSSWELVRGQENDLWKADLGPIDAPSVEVYGRKMTLTRNYINRKYMDSEQKSSQAVTFALGLEFLDTNHSYDNWFLQLETFDPHEPFVNWPAYRDLYPPKKSRKAIDWPRGGPNAMEPDEVEDTINEYRALVSMCDAYLGKILDKMDEYDLWNDTMLIVNTDHGFLLGEHDQWGKNVQPPFNEVANTPLFVWDPRLKLQGTRCKNLVQTIDLAPTLLEFFGLEIPKDMMGKPLKDCMANGTTIHEAGLFGGFGGHVCCTDGRYVYMRAAANAENKPLHDHYMIPTNMIGFYSLEQLRQTELVEPFSFTKGCKLNKVPGGMFGYVFGRSMQGFGTMLFDLAGDPEQTSPIKDPAAEERMIRLLVAHMKEADAPAEQYERLGLQAHI